MINFSAAVWRLVLTDIIAPYVDATSSSANTYNFASLELRQNVLYNMIFGVFVFYSEFCTLFIISNFLTLACYTGSYHVHQFNWLRSKRMFHAWSLVYTTALPFTFNTTTAFTLRKQVTTHNFLIHSTRSESARNIIHDEWLRPEQLRRSYTLWLLKYLQKLWFQEWINLRNDWIFFSLLFTVFFAD